MDKGEGGQLYFTTVLLGMVVGEVGLTEASSCHGEPFPGSIKVEIMLHMLYAGRFGGWVITKVQK